MLRNRQPLPPRSDKQDLLVERARALLPGGTTNSIVPPKGLEFLIVRGEGVHVYDADGRKFLDFLMGGGPLILGHAHPRLVETIARHAGSGTHHFGLTARALDLAERIVDYVPSAEMVRFTSTGSEATFHALRLSRAVTGRQGIIKFDGAWHGHHDLASWSLEHSPTVPPAPYPVSAGIQKGVAEDLVVLPFNDTEAFHQTVRAQPDRFAAVICEPLHRTLKPVPGFLEALREECDRLGIVLIFDEVVSGFRIAVGGAQAKYGVTPDLTTLGKAVGGGVPLSLLVGKRQYMSHFDPKTAPESFAFHCGTLNAYLLGVEASHTTLDLLVDEGGIDRLTELGDLMRDRLTRLFKDRGIVATVCGDGPIFHSYFIEGPVLDHRQVRASNLAYSDALHRRMYEAGIYKSFTKGYLSIAHDEQHIEELCDVMDWAIGDLK